MTTVKVPVLSSVSATVTLPKGVMVALSLTVPAVVKVPASAGAWLTGPVSTTSLLLLPAA